MMRQQDGMSFGAEFPNTLLLPANLFHSIGDSLDWWQRIALFKAFLDHGGRYNFSH
jgi:hypothetical protein